MKTEWNWLKKRAAYDPRKTAIIEGETGKTWSYLKLMEESLDCAQYLSKQGVKKGDRVALLAPNGVEYLVLLFACRELEAVFVPFNWRLSSHELNGLIADCKPVLLFIHPSFHNRKEELTMESTEYELESWAKGQSAKRTEQPSKSSNSALANNEDIPLDNPWMMIYTGGTTGKPKGAVLSYRAVFTNAVNTIITWGLCEDDVTLTVLPMFHTGGMNALTLPVLHAGGTVVIYAQFDAQSVLDGLVNYRCTNVLMVPTMYRAFVQLKDFKEASFSHMKVFLSGGAPCPVSIYDTFAAKGLPFKEGYGLTEAGPNNFFIHPDVAKQKRGSVGKPMLYNDIKLVNEAGKEVNNGEIGEMVIYGDHLFQAYWQKEKETADAMRNGGLYTGDLAYKDEDGDFFILGRKKEMLITGGENVYPLEVENIIAAYPPVLETAVVGLEDEKWGDKVVAAVVMDRSRPGLTEADVAEIPHKEAANLKEFCRQKLASYKVPKQIYLFNELPKTHVGKIDKKAIIDRIQQRKRIHKS
ncbi:MAG: AMP-binding protein [Bacillus sp. (in: Bacteria)]|nr:AMP-binding protein [Bacillus sp. (in: firmicutes)]